MYQPSFYKAAAIAIPMWIVTVVLTAGGLHLFYRRPVLGTAMLCAASIAVFFFAFIAAREIVESLWCDE